MIRETLTAIGQAGREAITKAAPRLEVQTQITQVREWSFAMPHLARVTVANSPIHQIYIGFQRPLAATLDQHAGGIETLLDHFKQALLMRVPAKRPICEWTILPADGQPRVLRGVRSFIVRQQTPAGNLYLMADVASRCEYEVIRQETWEEDLAERMLPRELGRLDVLDAPMAVDRLTTYLTRCEHDVELLVPGADGNVHACNAVFLNRQRDGDRQLMLLSMDLGSDVGADLTAGTALDGSFGAAGRVFRFQAVCERPEPLMLKDVGALPCFLFEVPSRFELDQRRRYFRVRPGGPLTAKVSVLPPEAAADGGEDPLAGPADRSGPPEHALAARVDDLSFSGAGLTIDVDTPGTLVRDSLVHLWIEGDELHRTVSLTGLVRRLQTAPRGRGRVRTSLGVEFVVRGPSDRMGTQALRQYVMSQQRLLLARRSAAADAETDATADAGSEPAPTP